MPDKIIALAGNPNVGKSTVFNALTGMNQHTGNWPGKTVANAHGYCHTANYSYHMVDLPGTYSLMAHSTEEEIARNYICFDKPDAVVVICDATCLERNLNLVLQTMEVSDNVIVCVNLLDEARRKHIYINLPLLSDRLGIPVVGVTAHKKKTLYHLTDILDKTFQNSITNKSILKIPYPEEIESIIASLENTINSLTNHKLNSRWLSLKLLDQDESLIQEIDSYLGTDFLKNSVLQNALQNAQEQLQKASIAQDTLKDLIVSALVSTAESLCSGVITYEEKTYDKTDRQIDKLLTNKLTGYPIMLGLLAFIFWLTITGANYPSGKIAEGLFRFQDFLTSVFHYLHLPDWLHGMLVLGVYRVLAWVVSVMLPPMAIFFPLFTLLEDSGYLPRIAYNLDKPFQRCCACGKQALTMCMGFGCNAAGIVGCRIIDSPRERLLAILTNNFVPCNGRFPTLIAILSMFFIGASGGLLSSLQSAILLTLIILLGILITFWVTKFLSLTILKGIPSSFTLELPPYRKPQIGKVILHSFFDRTFFVLGRAIVVAAPAGLIIWCMANLKIGNISVLHHCASYLDPFAKLMGLDGVILIAFILGFPANEIVVPIIIMAYMATGSILELDDLTQLKGLLSDNGWTWLTALNTMLFSLMHWPCSTTLLTIKKETASWKWTGLAALIPTVIGVFVCILLTTLVNLCSILF